MDKVPMTREGYDALVAELKRLKSVDRPDVIEAIAVARAHGDLAENAEYSAARERQSFIEGRIKEVEDVIGRAQIIDASSFTGSTVKFGATVLVADEATDVEESFTIVGEYETDSAARKISVTSPVGRALIGKSVGDSVEIRTPGGVKTYEIIEVKYPGSRS